MDSDKDKEPPKEDEPSKDGADATPAPKDDGPAPSDALSRTPEELAEEKTEQAAASGESNATSGEPKKKVSPIKRIFKRVNVYFLIFILLIVVAGAVTVVNYLNSQKVAPAPDVASQTLSSDALKQLANTDATVGNASQTLTIQGNAIITGQTLMHGNLNVAGNFQSGGSITAPSITVSGTSNLGTTQINSLQVATNTSIQGSTTLRDLNVAGTSSFSGAITASQITVTNLVLSGNATLQIPNHIAFTGPTPGRTVNTAPLGNGGSASISGSDTSGTLNISTGSNTIAGCFAHITFAAPFTNQPHVIISPVGTAAGQTEYYVDRDKTGFSICTATPAPTGQVFAFDYFIAN